MNKRPDWDSYFMEITKLAASRSTCLRRNVGATIIKDKHIISSGYNGVPSRIPHCGSPGYPCLRNEMNIPSGQRQELCRGLHAEQNAIIQAALHGVSTKGATLYCTHQPCITCSKMIINAGIVRIVFEGEYPDELARKMLADSGIEISIFKNND
jgi:dCMP deaminase